MFNVGGGELLVIALVALIVLGPDRLPGALRTAGQWMGELRRISSGFQTDFKTALADAEREAEQAKKADQPTVGELKATEQISSASPKAAAPMAPIPVPDPAPAPPDEPAAADVESDAATNPSDPSDRSDDDTAP